MPGSDSCLSSAALIVLLACLPLSGQMSAALLCEAYSVLVISSGHPHASPLTVLTDNSLSRLSYLVYKGVFSAFLSFFRFFWLLLSMVILLICVFVVSD